MLRGSYCLNVPACPFLHSGRRIFFPLCKATKQLHLTQAWFCLRLPLFVIKSLTDANLEVGL